MLKGLVIMLSMMVCLVVSGCGARGAMISMEYYKSNSAKEEYKTYAEEIYNGEITVEDALEKVGCEFTDKDSEYYKAFVDVIEAVNIQSRQDIIDTYGKWSKLGKSDQITATYMVMLGVVDIEVYDSDVQKVIKNNIKDIKDGRY